MFTAPGVSRMTASVLFIMTALLRLGPGLLGLAMNEQMYSSYRFSSPPPG